MKIASQGSSAVSLEGWKIMDEAGDTVTLYTEEGTDSATELYWGSGSPVWNNDGDVATLYNIDDELIDRCEK